jgi:predicted TIM-barrel fold metal-dependent hydrolase
VDKIWTNSGDSHFIEPDDIWHQILPKEQADRMPRSEKIGDSEEIIHIDGESFRRPLPKVLTVKGADGLTIAEAASRAPGARDLSARMADLDAEGVWAEVVFASIGLWSSMIKDPDLVRAAAYAENEWLVAEVKAIAPDRLVPAALIPMLDVDDAVKELEHAASIGLHAVSLPTSSPPGTKPYNHEAWEPLWTAAEQAGMVLAFHIGTDGDDQAAAYRGRGGAVLNYVHTTYGGQRVAMQLVTSGALDSHPGLKVLISEGGSSWVPFLGDRMNEGYRQHGAFVRPILSKLPKEILYRQVYTSFQHDESAASAMWANGYHNVMFGSDYPHLEGTYGHTQKTLHELLDDVSAEVRERITVGAFRELFPHTSMPPSAA